MEEGKDAEVFVNQVRAQWEVGSGEEVRTDDQSRTKDDRDVNWVSYVVTR